MISGPQNPFFPLRVPGKKKAQKFLVGGVARRAFDGSCGKYGYKNIFAALSFYLIPPPSPSPFRWFSEVYRHHNQIHIWENPKDFPPGPDPMLCGCSGMASKPGPGYKAEHCFCMISRPQNPIFPLRVPWKKKAQNILVGGGARRAFDGSCGNMDIKIFLQLYLST